VENYQKYLDPRTLAKLQGLELRARAIVEGYVAGMHKSPYHGFSIEFAEHREYVPGDDLRHVDWKVFGKTDKYYLKQYEEETNLVAYVVLDTSESMRYQSPDAPFSKLEYAQCIAAALSHLILQQQDSVGLVTFDREVRKFVPANGNPSHLKQLLHVMSESEAIRKTDTGPIFHELAERFTKRSVVLILSDLFDSVSSMLAGLKHFRHRRHDVIVFQVLDPAELDFPFRRTTMFKGLEQLPDVVTDPQSIRKAYLEELQRHLREVRKGCRSMNVDYQLIRTDETLDVALTGFLSARGART